MSVHPLTNGALLVAIKELRSQRRKASSTKRGCRLFHTHLTMNLKLMREREREKLAYRSVHACVRVSLPANATE